MFDGHVLADRKRVELHCLANVRGRHARRAWWHGDLEPYVRDVRSGRLLVEREPKHLRADRSVRRRHLADGTSDGECACHVPAVPTWNVLRGLDVRRRAVRGWNVGPRQQSGDRMRTVDDLRRRPIRREQRHAYDR
jgi:hypothetical protein